jgi:hypothetical protein
MDEDHSTWDDWDEDCHGTMDDDANRREYSEGFIWDCCEKRGGGQGEECRIGPHKARDIKKSRSSIDSTSALPEQENPYVSVLQDLAKPKSNWFHSMITHGPSALLISTTRLVSAFFCLSSPYHLQRTIPYHIIFSFSPIVSPSTACHLTNHSS